MFFSRTSFFFLTTKEIDLLASDFLEPFDYEVWFSLIVFIAFSSFILKLLGRIAQMGQQLAQNEIHFSSLVIIVGIFCQQGNCRLKYLL